MGASPFIAAAWPYSLTAFALTLALWADDTSATALRAPVTAALQGRQAVVVLGIDMGIASRLRQVLVLPEAHRQVQGAMPPSLSR